MLQHHSSQSKVLLVPNFQHKGVIGASGGILLLVVL
jgi:hypothetical protein